ncbi:hypothetical protein SAMN05216358_0097 [Rhizobium sp. AN5]|uniref:hypothetical protein n=1 Tax=Rhizobium sp. AN5 TaxID=1855304 RepID=UPI000BCC757F|nr:hypothetical protein [Rhizobium sp. AN5]SOC90078.1 hypothetical protein SAMN05216358_0097 [Rhizobium sp. AN5]
MSTALATIQQNAMPNTADLDALDAVLADLDIQSEGEEEGVIYETTPEDEAELEAAEEAAVAPTVLESEELADLDLALAKNEIYEEQKSSSVTTTELPAPTAAVRPKAKGERKAASSGVTRTPRDISKVADEFFVLSGDPSTMSDEDLKTARETTMKLLPAQVKVAEKFDNLFTALSVGKEPSVYVMVAFKLLDSKGSMTSADVVGAYKASGLGEGTARSQSGQIMNLFATVKIADRSGQTLTLRSDSKIAERLRSLVPAPAAS